MSNSILAKIESIFDFKYPKLYYQLANDGMLSIGKTGENWYTDTYLKLKENPPLLLYSDDFELLSLELVYETLEDMTEPDSYLHIKLDYHFIPFGQSGAGDYYCFFLNESTVEDIPITIVYHDENRAEYLAKNLQDFIFIEILKYMTDINEYKATNDIEFKVNVTHLLKTHLRYLSKSQQNCLNELINQAIVEYEVVFASGSIEQHRGFLTEQECQQKIVKLAPYKKLEKAFCYSDD